MSPAVWGHRAVLVASALCGLLGCAGGEADTEWPRIELVFVADANIDSGASFDGIDERFGGISAVVYEAERDSWFALSDAKVNPCFFRIDVHVQDGTLRVVPEAIIRLRAPRGGDREVRVLDPEGLVATSWGSWLVSTEPDARQDPPEQGKLLEFDSDAAFVRALPVPQKFLLEGWPPTQGARHNMGFEALSISPDGSMLFLGTEGTLLQDGPPAGFDRPGFSRIVRYDVVDGTFEPGAEYVYPVGPFAEVPGFEASAVTGGLVELVALSSVRLLALERVFIQEVEEPLRGRTRARVYDVDLRNATDVAGLASLAENLDWRPVSKQLLLDLDDVGPRFTPGFTELDNLEAMGLGPRLDGGDHLLLLASDDNFRATQRTQFLLFRLRGLRS